MTKLFFFTSLALAALVSLSACGKTDDELSSEAGSGNDGSGNSSEPPSADGCCPRDTTMSGSMRLGGHASRYGGSCVVTHDFFCSQNWRVEKDEHGCEEWRYDIRQPREDEGPMCSPLPPDGG